MDRSELELRYETMLEEYPDTKIIFSEGAAEQFAELMNAEKASSVVIFTGSSKGAAAKAMPNLQNLMAYMNLDFRFYMDIPAEPAVTDVRDMVRMLEEEKPQFVAALGGGSVMDAAKGNAFVRSPSSPCTVLLTVRLCAVRFTKGSAV